MLTDTLLTLEELAKHLHVTVDVVQQEINSGRLRAIIIAGQHYRVREGDVETYLNSSYATTAASAVPAAESSPTDFPINLHPGEDFAHIWPDKMSEDFTNVREGIATFNGKQYHVKVGFTVRKAAGHDRARAVVFVDRRPTVEFAAATEQVGANDVLASIIRGRDGKHVPAGASVPEEYSGTRVATYRSIVDGPGAANGMAVLCESSDVEGMVKHALIRNQYREERA